MRLRLYRINASTVIHDHRQPLIIDRFPYSLCDPTDWQTEFGHSSGENQCCQIELIGDTFYVTDSSPERSIRVNDCVVTCASILPGDRITLKSTEFLVSYERMTSASPVPDDYIFPNANCNSLSSPSTGKLSSADEKVIDAHTVSHSVLTDRVLV